MHLTFIKLMHNIKAHSTLPQYKAYSSLPNIWHLYHTTIERLNTLPVVFPAIHVYYPVYKTGSYTGAGPNTGSMFAPNILQYGKMMRCTCWGSTRKGRPHTQLCYFHLLEHIQPWHFTGLDLVTFFL